MYQWERLLNMGEPGWNNNLKASAVKIFVLYFRNKFVFGYFSGVFRMDYVN